MRKTIVGCRALLGEGALPSSGAVDIVVEGRLIREIRPHGAAEPDGDVVPAQGLLVPRPLDGILVAVLLRRVVLGMTVLPCLADGDARMVH